MRLAAALLLGLVVLFSAANVVWSRGGYALQDRMNIMAPASGQHVVGTDELGRDRANRICAAVLLGLVGAGAASLLASGLAAVFGMAAAAGPAWLRHSMLYGCDLFFTLPWIFLLMLVRSALPLSMPALQAGSLTFLLLALLGAPTFLRINHERTTALMSSEWLFHARASGLRPLQLLRQCLPHLRTLFWTQFLLYVPACLIAEANLGALGLGIGEPAPSWGTMVAGLQCSVLVSNSRLIYLPIAVLVLILVALELTIFEEQR